MVYLVVRQVGVVPIHDECISEVITCQLKSRGVRRDPHVRLTQMIESSQISPLRLRGRGAYSRRPNTIYNANATRIGYLHGQLLERAERQWRQDERVHRLGQLCCLEGRKSSSQPTYAIVLPSTLSLPIHRSATLARVSLSLPQGSC